jgi:hypothetical protein
VRQEADAGACGVAGAGRLEHAAKEKEAMARILGAMMNKMSGKPSGAGGQWAVGGAARRGEEHADAEKKIHQCM